MSHVFDTKLVVLDLDALSKACESISMELVLNQKNYKWYGHHVGDYPLPAGFSASDMGRCDHVLRIKGNRTAYEVGVCKRRDGQEGYTLIYDFWAGGHGLESVIGDKGKTLKQSYQEQVIRKKLELKGLRGITRRVLEDGRIAVLYQGR